MSELQAAGDWARLDSVKRYAVTEVARRKELLEGKVIKLQSVHSDVNDDAQAIENK